MNRIALALILFVLVSCHSSLHVQHRSAIVYNIEKDTPSDSNIVKMLHPYKLGVDTQMSVIIGHTDIPLTKAQPESSIGNLIADAQLEAAKKTDNKVVGSVVNYGGMRLNYIAPGVITKGKMYELMPFDNTVVVAQIPGDVLKKFCDHMAKYKGWPISGITYTIKDKEAVNIKVGIDPLNENLVYNIAISDYIANGGDNCDFLKPLRKKFTTIFVRDALIDYIARHEKNEQLLHPVIEKRIQYAE